MPQSSGLEGGCLGPTGTSILSLVIHSPFFVPLFLHKGQSPGGSLGSGDGVF